MDKPQRLDNPDQLGIGCDTSLPLHAIFFPQVLQRAAWRPKEHRDAGLSRTDSALHLSETNVSLEEAAQLESDLMKFWRL